MSFVDWYNHKYHHSGITLAMPQQRQSGHAVEIIRRRTHDYEKDRPKNLQRLSRSSRCWRQPQVVWVNKPPEDPMSTLALPLAQAA